MKNTYAAGAYFEARLSYDARRETVWRAVVRNLERYVLIEGAVLDLGAGYCHFINNVKAARRYAVDIWPGMKGHAAPDVRVHIGETDDLTFVSGPVDVVFASNLFEHLTDAQFAKTLEAVRTVLKPGGRLIVVQPNFRYAFREYFDDYTHIRVFTDRGLAGAIAAAGLTVERIVPRYLPYSMAQAGSLPVPGWLVRLYLALPWKPFARQMLIIASNP